MEPWRSCLRFQASHRVWVGFQTATCCWYRCWTRKCSATTAPELHEHADLSEVATSLCNDMTVDAQGRAYVGNFGFDLHAGDDLASATLALVQPTALWKRRQAICGSPTGRSSLLTGAPSSWARARRGVQRFRYWRGWSSIQSESVGRSSRHCP